MQKGAQGQLGFIHSSSLLASWWRSIMLILIKWLYIQFLAQACFALLWKGRGLESGESGKIQRSSVSIMGHCPNWEAAIGLLRTFLPNTLKFGRYICNESLSMFMAITCICSQIKTCTSFPFLDQSDCLINDDLLPDVRSISAHCVWLPCKENAIAHNLFLLYCVRIILPA